MLDDFHIPGAETTRRAMSVHVPLGGVMINRVCSAVSLERAIRASRERLIARDFKHSQSRVARKETTTGVAVHITQAECPVLHLGKHP